MKFCRIESISPLREFLLFERKNRRWRERVNASLVKWTRFAEWMEFYSMEKFEKSARRFEKRSKTITFTELPFQRVQCALLSINFCHSKGTFSKNILHPFSAFSEFLQIDKLLILHCSNWTKKRQIKQKENISINFFPESL